METNTVDRLTQLHGEQVLLRWERCELWDWGLEHPNQDVRRLRRRAEAAWNSLKIVAGSLAGRREWIRVDPPWKGLSSVEFPKEGLNIPAIRAAYELLKVRVAYLDAASPEATTKWKRFCEVRRQLRSNAREIKSLAHLTPIDVKRARASLWIYPQEAGEFQMKCLFRNKKGATLGVAGLNCAELCEKLSDLPTHASPLKLMGMRVYQLVTWKGAPQPIRTQEELATLKKKLLEEAAILY